MTAIAAGDDLVGGLALKSDGTVVGWGNGDWHTDVPPGLTGVTAIDIGTFSSLALKDDGTVVGWGWQTDVPTGLSGVTAIAAGGEHNLALTRK